MSPEWLAPIMFIVVLTLIFKGYPVALTLGGVSLIFAGIGVATGAIFSFGFLAFIPERLTGVMENKILLAIPFFIFMGTMLEKSNLAEDLLHTIGQLFGSLRGGLALAVVFVGALLAAATGVVGASVVAMGMISLPVMLRNGYNKPFATGTIAAAGTLGQIIPPSVVLIVLADQIAIAASDELPVSVGDLFKGALTPGILLALMFALYVSAVAWLKPAMGPALPPEERASNRRELIRRVLFSMLPPLLLILIVLGSIFAAVASPTEAGALGAAGAMILAACNRRLNRKTLRDTVQGTSKVCCMIMFLLIGSSIFALVFRELRGDHWIEEMLTNLPGGLIGGLIIANLAIFVLGFFIDFFEITFIVVPLLAPVFVSQGVDPVWFGVMIAMNLQTSFLTPPFGFSLFYLKGICPPGIKTSDIYRGVIPYIIIQAVALLAICVFPELVLWLVR